MILTRYATREEWLAARRTMLGGSDLASILGAPDAFSTPTKVWERKVFGDARDESLDAIPEWLEWGNRLEPVVLAALAQKATMEPGDYDPTPYTIVRPDDGPAWMGASPDGLARDAATGAATAVLEAKTTNRWNEDEWAEGAPLRYAVQVQWTLACTGAPLGYIGVLIGGQRFRWARVERDEGFIAVARREAERFWRSVETKTPPAAVDADTRAAIQRIYPQDDGREVELPPEFSDLTRRYHEAQAAKEQAEKEIEVVQAWVCRAIGGATVGKVASGERWQWKEQKRKGYTVTYPEWRGRVLKLLKAKEE